MMIQRMINNLPLDVVLYIIPYTYQTQNKKLLHDIVDYKKSKSIIFDLYYDLCIDYLQETEDNLKDLLITPNRKKIGTLCVTRISFCRRLVRKEK